LDARFGHTKPNGYYGDSKAPCCNASRLSDPTGRTRFTSLPAKSTPACSPRETLDIRTDLTPTYCVNAETCEGPLVIYDFILTDPPYIGGSQVLFGPAAYAARAAEVQALSCRHFTAAAL